LACAASTTTCILQIKGKLRELKLHTVCEEARYVSKALQILNACSLMALVLQPDAVVYHL
jgi:hypothetical protein